MTLEGHILKTFGTGPRVKTKKIKMHLSSLAPALGLLAFTAHDRSH